MYTIGQLARRFALSRSTLLYYDEIGLLSPSARSSSNYRLYSDDDLRRMERIHTYRQAGLPLESIAALLQDGGDSISVVLEEHLRRLSLEIDKLRHQQRLIAELSEAARLTVEPRSLTKGQWVTLLASSGMSEEGMRKWHAEFEKNFPDAHQDFLASLGIPAEEIAAIRKLSGEDISTVEPPAHTRNR